MYTVKTGEKVPVPIGILGTGSKAEGRSGELLSDGKQVVECERLEQLLTLHERVAQLRRERGDRIHLLSRSLGLSFRLSCGRG